MQKCYNKGTHLRFSRKKSAAATKFYRALKVDGILESLSSLVFCNEVVLGEHILSI